MMRKIRETVRDRVLPFNYERLSIEYSQMKEDTILSGAAAIAVDWLLNNFRCISERFKQVYGKQD